MKKIDFDTYSYKGYEIMLYSHPKLYGKYEIYKGDKFICRALTLSDAKIKINEDIKKEN